MVKIPEIVASGVAFLSLNLRGDLWMKAAGRFASEDTYGLLIESQQLGQAEELRNRLVTGAVREAWKRLEPAYVKADFSEGEVEVLGYALSSGLEPEENEIGYEYPLLTETIGEAKFQWGKFNDTRGGWDIQIDILSLVGNFIDSTQGEDMGREVRVKLLTDLLVYNFRTGDLNPGLGEDIKYGSWTYDLIGLNSEVIVAGINLASDKIMEFEGERSSAKIFALRDMAQVLSSEGGEIAVEPLSKIILMAGDLMESEEEQISYGVIQNGLVMALTRLDAGKLEGLARTAEEKGLEFMAASLFGASEEDVAIENLKRLYQSESSELRRVVVEEVIGVMFRQEGSDHGREGIKRMMIEVVGDADREVVVTMLEKLYRYSAGLRPNASAWISEIEELVRQEWEENLIVVATLRADDDVF